MDELMQDFLTETVESLALIDNDLVAFEQTPDNPDLIRNIFRMVHTIKGTCGFIGLARLGHVAHAAENVLGLYRDGKLAPSAASIGIVLEAIDRIKAIVAGIEAKGAEPAGDDTELVARLDQIVAGDVAPVSAAVPETPDFEPVLAAALIEAQADDATDASIDDPADAVAPAAQPTHAPAANAPAANASGESAGGSAASGQSANQTIRVTVAVLENLMTAVSELVLTRNQLVQGIRDIELGSVQVPLQRLSQLVSELQQGVMKTRMQPIGNAWQKLPRLIRDLANEVGKKIDLDLHGAETEVDRQVLEIIKDPLTHMVRNSADHGLETPAERSAAGKREAGSIHISACHQGGHIVIEIADDGRGLNTARIRQKIVEKGLLSAAETAALSDAQVHRYIFDAGFSTAAKVTAVSGRGVGMDVVRSNIEKIGGAIDLSSVEGKGTRFTIRIPLTLAIASALIVEAGGERFAIPQVSVLELVLVSKQSQHQIETLNGNPLLRLRDRLLPLVHLDAALGLASSGQRDQEYVLVLQTGSQTFGIVVDRVLDTEEIVVKPVAPILKDLTTYAGNTILGDGSVIMILDPNGLAQIAAMAEVADDHAVVDNRAAAQDHVTADNTGLLVFANNEGDGLSAIPLDRVDRIENLDVATVQRSGGRLTVQYRDKLMPLVRIGEGGSLPATGRRPTLVFTTPRGPVGLAVHRIVDVVYARVEIGLKSRTPAYLGTAIVAGKTMEIVDVDQLMSLDSADMQPAPKLALAA